MENQIEKITKRILKEKFRTQSRILGKLNNPFVGYFNDFLNKKFMSKYYKSNNLKKLKDSLKFEILIKLLKVKEGDYFIEQNYLEEYEKKE